MVDLHASCSMLRVFVAGYIDVTTEEFAIHYHDELDRSIARSDRVLLSDEPGTCDMVVAYLRGHDVPASRITIYRSAQSTRERPYEILDCGVVHVEGGETGRYEAMASASNGGNIIWTRPDDGLKGFIGGETPDMRFSGPKEASRCVVAESFRRSMAAYDAIV